MTNHPNRSQSAKKQAQSKGYYIREGSYIGTTDDRLGRWYYGHESDNGFRPYGAGHRTQREAWEAALEHASRTDLESYSGETIGVIDRILAEAIGWASR